MRVGASDHNWHGGELTMSTQTLLELVQERPDVAWEVASLLPGRGEWREEDYLWLTNHTNRLVEFSDGYIEVLTTPTDEHQRIVLFLYRMLYSFITTYTSGIVLVAPLRVRLQSGKYREPDIIVLLSQTDHRRENQYWNGADLVMEIVSPDDLDRDLVTKRAEYAQIGIPEYWIVNPKTETITVLRLQDDMYIEFGEFERGQSATSVVLHGFAVHVGDALDAR
jgi:Uma2 family endonuclease